MKKTYDSPEFIIARLNIESIMLDIQNSEPEVVPDETVDLDLDS